MADKLIEPIFDPEDTELGIGINERSELVKAYLTNAESIRRSFQLSKLWELISKWPIFPGSPQALVYLFFEASDGTKAKVYQGCNEPVFRQCILKNSTERDIDTLRLGMKDADEHCREIALSKKPHG